MRNSVLRSLLAGSVAGLALCVAAGDALAAGFSNRQHSAYFSGSAFAGIAVGGGSPAAMFWNPATITGFNSATGFISENNYTLLVPNTRINPVGGPGNTPAQYLPLGGSGNIGEMTVIPATYLIYRPDAKWALGLSINSPYGLTTKPNSDWAGAYYSRTTSARTFTFTPTIAYQFNEQFSVGVGLQVQYFEAVYRAAAFGPPFPFNVTPQDRSTRFDASGVGVGFTLGMTWKPIDGTELGFGFRSGIDQPLSGYVRIPAGAYFPVPPATAPVSLDFAAESTLELPHRADFSFRQRLTPTLDLLGTVEWAGWGRIGSPEVKGPAGAILPALPFGYKDSWFFALGAEWKALPNLTIRTGLAYETSPVDTSTRSTRLPDSNRIYASLGASYQWNDRTTLNLGVTNIFYDGARIDIQPGDPLYGRYPFVANTSNNVLSVSFGITTRWGGTPSVPAAAPAVVK